MIIEVDLYSQIRTRYEDGESQRSIAKCLGISRQTVKKYCEGNTHPEVRKSYTRVHNVITSDIKNFIISCLRQDLEEKLSKQQHTAKRVYCIIELRKVAKQKWTLLHVQIGHNCRALYHDSLERCCA